MNGQLTIENTEADTEALVKAERRRLARHGRRMAGVRREFDTLRGLAREFAIEANEAGLGDTEIARLLDVHRITVRRWIGK